MKKNNLLGVLFFTPFFLQSQITLTADNFATVDESYKMSTASTQSDIDLETGANYHWDYSHLIATNQKEEIYNDIDGLGFLIKAQFGPMAPQRFKATYYLPNPDLPLQNLPSFLPIQISDLNEMYQVAEDSLSLVGSSINFNGQGVPIRNTDVEKIYQFPLTYGDDYETYGSFNKNMNPIFDAQWKQKRNHTVSVDGWGKIKTPNGTYQVLRIHHVIKQQDSLYVSMSGFSSWFPITTRTGIYEWRAANEKNPVLRIKTMITGQNESVRSIEFRDDREFVDVNEIMDNQLEIYPNPVRNVLTIKGIEGAERFGIYTSDGKLVREGFLKNSMIDCSDLMRGIYFIRLNGDSVGAYTRFVKE